MSRPAAIFDLDRTLINTSSAPVFQRHLATAGLGEVPHIPLADAFLKYYETFGESWILMQPAKLGVRSSKGWPIAGIHEAMVSAAAELETMLMPFAKVVFEQHRKNGDLLVMATTSPFCCIALTIRSLCAGLVRANTRILGAAEASSRSSQPST